MKKQDPFLVMWLKSTRREVRRTDNGSSAFIHSSYNVSLEKVWHAITLQDELAKWFGKVSGDMTQNAELTFYLGADISSHILKFEPLHNLSFTWTLPGRETDTVKIELKSSGRVTILELEQYSKDMTDWWFGAGAGWESALIRLGLLLQNENPKRISGETFDEVLGPLWTYVGKHSV